MLKLAIVSCFIVALLDESDIWYEETRKIKKSLNAFIEKHPDNLELANTAWDLACDMEDQPAWDPVLTAVRLFGIFQNDLNKIVNSRHFKALENKRNASLKAKIGSVKVAKSCISAINKTLYDFKV